MMVFLSAVTVAALVLIIWIFIGYGIVLALLTLKRQTAANAQHRTRWPAVTLIVPTLNESAVIEKKIANISALDYPTEQLEVIVSDGASDDATLELVHAHAPTYRIIRAHAQGGGKSRAINLALLQAQGEIVVVTDANAFMEPPALRRVIAVFQDPAIGAATGSMRQIDRSNNAVSQGGGLYWIVETFLRKLEARLHSVVAMSGELSAFRKSLFVDTHNRVRTWYRRGGTDDFEMTLWTIRHGYRVGYAPDAIVWEYAPDSARDLFRQKVRIIAQTIVSVRRNISAIFTTGWYGVLIFPSRKILPLFAPFALLMLLTGSTVLASQSWFWHSILALQVVGYILAAAGADGLRSFPPARFALFFVLLHATILAAWLEIVRRKDYTHWQPIASSRRL